MNAGIAFLGENCSDFWKLFSPEEIIQEERDTYL